MTSENEHLQKISTLAEKSEVREAIASLLDFGKISLTFLKELSNPTTFPAVYLLEVGTINEHPGYSSIKAEMISFWKLLAAAVRTPDQDPGEVYTVLEELVA